MKDVCGTIGFGADRDMMERFQKLVQGLKVNKSDLARRAFNKGLQAAVEEYHLEKERHAQSLEEAKASLLALCGSANRHHIKPLSVPALVPHLC